MSLEARETKAKINYWDYIKVKSFCTAKETIHETKRRPMEWKKVFADDISDKRLVSRYIQRTDTTEHRKTSNNSIKNWQNRGAWVAQSVKRPTSARSRSRGPGVRAPRQALG